MNVALSFLSTIKRRWILMPIVAQLCSRGWVLHGQPFPTFDVPVHISSAFFVGAAALMASIVIPSSWTDKVFVVGAASAGVPYLMYVGWVLGHLTLSGIVVATLGDLLLVPYLVALTWGRYRMPETEVDDDG